MLSHRKTSALRCWEPGTGRGFAGLSGTVSSVSIDFATYWKLPHHRCSFWGSDYTLPFRHWLDGDNSNRELLPPMHTATSQRSHAAM